VFVPERALAIAVNDVDGRGEGLHRRGRLFDLRVDDDRQRGKTDQHGQRRARRIRRESLALRVQRALR